MPEPSRYTYFKFWVSRMSLSNLFKWQQAKHAKFIIADKTTERSLIKNGSSDRQNQKLLSSGFSGGYNKHTMNELNKPLILRRWFKGSHDPTAPNHYINYGQWIPALRFKPKCIRLQVIKIFVLRYLLKT